MKWQEFLNDAQIDTSLGYQPPEKHLFGKMIHDILESINALLGWSQMGEDLKLTDEFPEPARAWLLRNVPILQQEREHIYALSANFLHQTDTLDGWLGLVDEMGKSASRVSILQEDLGQLDQSSSPLCHAPRKLGNLV